MCLYLLRDFLVFFNLSIEKFISKILRLFKCFCFLNIINYCFFFFLNGISSDTINWFGINIFPWSCRIFKTMLKKIHKFETLKKASDFKILVKKFPFSFIIKNDKTWKKSWHQFCLYFLHAISLWIPSKIQNPFHFIWSYLSWFSSLIF